MWRFVQFMLMATECLTGVEMLLFEASQVSRTPLSDLLRSVRITVEVTVEPDETSDEVRSGSPDQNHLTSGFGRPAKKAHRRLINTTNGQFPCEIYGFVLLATTSSSPILLRIVSFCSVLFVLSCSMSNLKERPLIP